MLLFGVGVLLSITALIWMLVVQIQNKHYIWGVATLILWFPGLIYGALNFGIAKSPFFMLIFSQVLMAVGKFYMG